MQLILLLILFVFFSKNKWVFTYLCESRFLEDYAVKALIKFVIVENNVSVSLSGLAVKFDFPDLALSF